MLCWQGAKSICYGQSELHSGELEVHGRKRTQTCTSGCCAEFFINSRNQQIRSKTHSRTHKPRTRRRGNPEETSCSFTSTPCFRHFDYCHVHAAHHTFAYSLATPRRHRHAQAREIVGALQLAQLHCELWFPLHDQPISNVGFWTSTSNSHLSLSSLLRTLDNFFVYHFRHESRFDPAVCLLETQLT